MVTENTLLNQRRTEVPSCKNTKKHNLEVKTSHEKHRSKVKALQILCVGLTHQQLDHGHLSVCTSVCTSVCLYVCPSLLSQMLAM